VTSDSLDTPPPFVCHSPYDQVLSPHSLPIPLLPPTGRARAAVIAIAVAARAKRSSGRQPGPHKEVLYPGRSAHSSSSSASESFISSSSTDISSSPPSSPAILAYSPSAKSPSSASTSPSPSESPSVHNRKIILLDSGKEYWITQPTYIRYSFLRTTNAHRRTRQ